MIARQAIMWPKILFVKVIESTDVRELDVNGLHPVITTLLCNKSGKRERHTELYCSMNVNFYSINFIIKFAATLIRPFVIIIWR